VDDIAKQARYGSVSAIIQVLNEKLADSGIRTRAIFSQGVLQLLCEAATPEQLDQPTLIPHLRSILESIQPRNVRRVNVNSRIVREQQLLWLEEINRAPEDLLWSEEIALTRPGFLQRFAQDWQDNRVEPTRSHLSKGVAGGATRREKKVFWRGLLGGASLTMFLLLLGWALHNWLSPKLTGPTQAETTTPASEAIGSEATAAPQANPTATDDPFAEAVRLAEATVAAGKTAQTSAEWLDLASQWQKASDLMSQIKPEDDRYAVAQDRVKLYRQNSEAATQEAAEQRK
jgi:hypothetical protein